MRDNVYCIQCDAYTYVAGRNPEEWHAKCVHIGSTRKCGFGRWTGKGGRELAIRAAVNHRKRNPAHVVNVFDPDGNLWRTFDGGTGVLRFPGFGESPSDDSSAHRAF